MKVELSITISKHGKTRAVMKVTEFWRKEDLQLVARLLEQWSVDSDGLQNAEGEAHSRQAGREILDAKQAFVTAAKVAHALGGSDA